MSKSSLLVACAKGKVKHQRKMLATCFLLLSANAFSAELQFQECLTLFGALKFNQYLEYYCNFNGGVSDKINRMYVAGGCPDTVSQEVVNSMLNDVDKDSKMRMEAFGKTKFCAANSDGYFDLSK